MKPLFSFVKTLYTRRETLWAIAWRDLKVRYIGSYLGFLWIFIQPAVTVFLMWFIFDVGFRSRPVEGLPFIVWLLCGYFPWLFIAECLTLGTTAIRDNAYLVQKVVFPVSILPVAKILTALIIHLFLLGLLFLLLWSYGYPPGIYALQLPYYVLCAAFLVLGATWFSSAVNVFIRDLGQAISVLVQFAFWPLAGAIFLFGAYFFKRLRPHFADVL